MILKCPNCGEQYEISANGKIENFTMKCHSCGTTISSEENEEIEVRRLNHNNESQIEKKDKSHSGCLWSFLTFIIIIIIMMFTRPDKPKHAEKVRQIGMQLMNDKMEDEDGLTQGLAFLFGPYVMDRFIDMGLQIDDYYIFNVGRIKFQDIDKPVTIGVFNNVILLVNPDKIKEKDNQEE